jgi:CRP-like cAMP-binding protein
MDPSLFKIISNIPALSEIDEDDLFDAAKKAVLMGYPKDCTIYDIGDESTHFYLIKSGKVEILRKDQNGQLLQVEKHYPDNFFGEMALVEDTKRETLARCIENSEIYLFDINDFKEFLYI